ncbi:cellulose binding domain-containing protein [Streptomyces sp. NPDC048639]|uniref:cellulose binding domain-containing protein n=1 Tax=Streptomyces sp. NPDC048639 TaxID=3365581 RepID=UPI00371D9BDE
MAALSSLGLIASGLALSPTASAAETYSGVGTHFDATGQDGGACGVPPEQIESRNFVALNVWDTPGYFEYDLPRPVPPDRADIKGMWDNGRNCGRWVQIKLSDFCSVANGGQPGAGICTGGEWRPDEYNGATVNAVITDSCGDGNEWCRSSKYHLDLSRYSLGQFTQGGSPVGDLETMGKWNNRKIDWSFIPAPGHSGDIKLGFAKDAYEYYSPVIITNLPNGIHGVQYHDGSSWKSAQTTGDSGQRYEIQPYSADRRDYRIRVIDADDQLLYGGREYAFSRPSGCDRCTALYTPVDYTTSGGGVSPENPTSEDTQAPGAPSGLTATGTTGSSVSLAWDASSDNVGVAGYDIHRNGQKVGSSSGTSYIDTGLSPSTAYAYEVRARDAANNVSSASNTVNASTPAGGSDPGGGSDCIASMAVTQSWSGGFNADVTVKNTGGTATKAWKAQWTWPGGQSVSNHWSAQLAQSGSSVTASNVDYNASVAPSGTTTFGVTANGSVPSSLPAVTCTVTG